MKKNFGSAGLIGAFVIVISMLLSSFTVNTHLENNPDNLLNTTLFSVQIGDLGIHYKTSENNGIVLGPTTLVIDDNNTF